MDVTMKRRALAAGAAALGVLAAQTARAETGSSTWDQIMQTKKLRVGAALSDPWYYRDNAGSPAPGGVKVNDVIWRGIGPRLADLIAHAMGVQLEMVEVTWGTAVAALQANQIDTMFILDATPERALAVEFVPTPALWYPVALLAKSDVKLRTWKEINDPGFKIGSTLGSSTDQTATRLAPNATWQRFPTTGEMLATFQSGRVDAIVTTGPTIDLAIARMKTGISIVPKPVVAIPGGSAVRFEADRRWGAYLNTLVGYFYNTGITEQIYEEFVAFRGLDPSRATPVQRENW